ncbi:hypothetical protein EZV62_027145 [Acer yangbiense]|uniref:CCHC-type domain-containing protein n=1 Tax=Acer yangbiense TaxID=1000413 RepID=A0A5C7GSW1_9ROSI|nr:hypothetical protein EZV62_027145 [Acer yangbiense]
MGTSEIVKLCELLSLDDNGKVEMEVLADNVFMFFFNKAEDRDAIWKRGPWHFDNNLIVLEKPLGAGELSNLSFDKVIEIPADARECRGRFLRVKVRIDIDKPLKRFLKLEVDESERVVVAPLIYKRLPEFCFACGKIGHNLKECPDDEARIEALEGTSTKFGAWMRAPGLEMGKSKNQKQMGKSSSEQDGGKSTSTSDGSTKGGDMLRIEHNYNSNGDRAESGGSVGKLNGNKKDGN